MLSFGNGERGRMGETGRVIPYSDTYSRDRAAKGLGNALYHYPLA